MKKKYIILPMLLMSLFNSSFAFAQTNTEVKQPSVQASTASQKMVVTQAVNVRSTPEMTDNIIGQFRGGEVVTVSGQSDDNLWYKVDLNGKAGWVFIRFLKNQQEGPVQMKVTRAVNVRSSAGLGNNVLGQYKKDELIDVTDISSDGLWYKVNFKGQEGWVSASYVQRFWASNLSGFAGKLSEETSTDAVLHKTVTRDLNVRSYPGMGKNIIGHFKKGDSVDVSEKSKGGFWCKVNFNKGTGWVACKFLSD